MDNIKKPIWIWESNAKNGMVGEGVYALTSLHSIWLTSVNEHPTDDLDYLSIHTPVSLAIHDTFGREPVYLVSENLECFIAAFTKVLT